MKFLQLILFGLLLSSAQYASAQTREVSGSISLPYKGKLFSSLPSGEERSEAIRTAKLQAWELYTANFSSARMQRYLEIQSSFIENIDAYIPSVRVLDEQLDRRTRVINLLVSAVINEAAVDAMLISTSAAGQQRSGGGSYFTFVFVARRTLTSTIKDDRRVDMNLREGAGVASEDLITSETGASSSSEYRDLEKTTSGGSVTRSAVSRQYEVLSAQDIDSAMSSALTTAGFEIVNYGDVVSACGGAEPSVIDTEYRDADEMSRETRQAAIAAARDCDVPLFATGTVDVGLEDIDPVTGNSRVFVSVRGQVWNVAGRLPRRVASVGPVQFSGLGPDDEVARRNALNLAASKAAEEIIEQLNLKGIR